MTYVTTRIALKDGIAAHNWIVQNCKSEVDVWQADGLLTADLWEEIWSEYAQDFESPFTHPLLADDAGESSARRTNIIAELNARNDEREELRFARKMWDEDAKPVPIPESPGFRVALYNSPFELWHVEVMRKRMEIIAHDTSWISRWGKTAVGLHYSFADPREATMFKLLFQPL